MSKTGKLYFLTRKGEKFTKRGISPRRTVRVARSATVLIYVTLNYTFGINCLSETCKESRNFSGYSFIYNGFKSRYLTKSEMFFQDTFHVNQYFLSIVTFHIILKFKLLVFNTKSKILTSMIIVLRMAIACLVAQLALNFFTCSFLKVTL